MCLFWATGKRGNWGKSLSLFFFLFPIFDEQTNSIKYNLKYMAANDIFEDIFIMWHSYILTCQKNRKNGQRQAPSLCTVQLANVLQAAQNELVEAGVSSFMS